MFSAFPESICGSIKENINKSDLVAIIATLRYLQEDLSNKKLTTSISENIHIVVGMTYANNKPILIFSDEVLLILQPCAS